MARQKAETQQGIVAGFSYRDWVLTHVNYEDGPVGRVLVYRFDRSDGYRSIGRVAASHPVNENRAKEYLNGVDFWQQDGVLQAQYDRMC